MDLFYYRSQNKSSRDQAIRISGSGQDSFLSRLGILRQDLNTIILGSGEEDGMFDDDDDM